MLVIGDTDALISTINKDSNHHLVRSIYNELAKIEAEIYFPTAIIAETITTCQRKLNNPNLAQAMVTQLTSKLIDTIPTTHAVLQLATSFYNPRGSKQNTFFDAIVAATAKQQNADAIFSFDDWYINQGFKLAKDFIKT